MKFFALLFLLLFIVKFTDAQNLVLNPSFEDTVHCPNSLGQVSFANHWHVFGATPDYYNECSSSYLVAVPDNFAGFHNAASGVAYMGLIMFTTDVANPFEYIGGQLTQPLNVGEQYLFSVKISPAYSDSIGVNLACNNFGVLFTNHQYSLSQPVPTNNFCHINFPTIVTDTLGWTTLTGNFISDSDYHYIVMGNFHDRAHTDTLHIGHGIPNGFWGAYYYVDDISVSSTLGLTSQSPSSLTLYPNPVATNLTVSGLSNNASIQITDISGRVLFTSNIQHQPSNIDMSAYPSGVYILRSEGEVRKVVKM